MRVDWCVSSWFRIKNTHSHLSTALTHPTPWFLSSGRTSYGTSRVRHTHSVHSVLSLSSVLGAFWLAHAARTTNRTSSWLSSRAFNTHHTEFEFVHALSTK